MKITPVSYNNYTHKKTDRVACKNHSSIQANNSSYSLANNNTQSIGNINHGFVSFGEQIRIAQASTKLRERVQKLAKAYLDKPTDENFRKLHDAMLPTIRMLSSRYANLCVEDDLINLGRFTLYKALDPEKYDPERGDFLGYVTQRLKGAMVDYLREENRQKNGISVSSARIQRELEKLAKKRGHRPTLEEATKALPHHRVESIKRAMLELEEPKTISLDAPGNSNSDALLSGVIPGFEVTAEQELLQAEARKNELERMYAAVDCLPKAQRKTVIKYFGLHGEDPRLLRQIGKELDVSESTICIRKKEGLGTLKSRLKEEDFTELYPFYVFSKVSKPKQRRNQKNID